MAERRGGFVLADLIAVCVVVSLLAVMLLAAGAETRRQARLGEDIAKLRQFGAATGGYAADNADQFWTFSWRKGATLSQWADLNAQAQLSDQDACAAQAVDILRRLAGREDIQPITAWFPHWFYSHLPLTEYLNGKLPAESAISSADGRRLAWARDPQGFDAGLYQPSPYLLGQNATRRWPYSASFQLEAAFYDGGVPGGRVSQATHATVVVPNGGTLAPRVLSETAFPSQKVHLHDTHARHFGPRVPYCTHDQARLPLLLVDGHVAVRAAADANGGWDPNTPLNPSPDTFYYQPAAWEPPTLSGQPLELVIGRFRWTRGCSDTGLKGRDFGGPEPCPPPP